MHLPGWAGSQATLDQSCEAPRVRLTGLDTAFLCLDRDVSPMHLGALAIFRPVHLDDPGRLAAVLADRAQCLPQLCQRVQPSEFPLAAAVWVDDPGFCAKDHIELHSLDCPGGPDCRDSAAELAVELMIRPMQRNRPLWEFHVISGLEGGRFAVLFKMHHAFCDGLSALEIGLRVVDEVKPRGGGARRSGTTDDRWPLSTQRSVQSRLWRVPGDLRDAVGSVAVQMSQATRIATSVLRRVRLPFPASPLVTMSSGRRTLTMARLDLPQVRRIRAHYGGTVNDVLLAVVTGGLREWLVTRGHPVEGLILRAFIPVSQRARSRNRTGGNRLSGYLCDLPVGEPDPGKRLLTIRRAMDQSKAAGADSGPGAIPVLADRLPPAVHRVAAPVAGQGASLLFDLMVTSIPVPSMPFTLDGAELEEVFPIAPLAAGQALVVGLSWYQDTAYIALHADREALPDAQRLAEAMQPAVVVLNDLVERAHRVASATSGECR
ncbi:MAG: wax ester/triacylglycerol synthase family O-acyltransferase [Pseudonocardiales bacterium]|nr:wax ester/triacylglycerol synthase family O-acyltransferase [Pseudonocardiales bacterium]